MCDTCSLCQLEVFTSLVDGRGRTGLEWLGNVPIPSPHFGERKERSMYLNVGTIEERGERESDREMSVSQGILAKIAYVWRKKDYGGRGKMRQCLRIGEFNRDCVL